MRAKRALHLGMAEDQPGYFVLDLESRKTVVTPHVRFVEDVFPGLSSAPRGVEPTPHDMQHLFEHHTITGDTHEHGDLDAPPLEEIDGGTGIEIAPDEAPDAGGLPSTRPSSESSETSHDDIDGGAEEGLNIEEPHENLDVPEGCRTNPWHDGRIATRTRSHQSVGYAGNVDRSSNVSNHHKYFLYLGSGPAREGDVSSHLKELDGWPIICIDLKVGGYDHDLTHEHTQKRVLDIASDPRCLGAFISIPCKTYSVLRSKPGVEFSYPLRDASHVLGIPRPDGTLPFKVVQSNIMSEFVAKVMRAVHSNNGVFVAESPPGRGIDSRFPISGREDHVSQFDHPDWVKLSNDTNCSLIYFDQCPLYNDPPALARKKTALMVNPKGYHAFYKRFAPLVCPHDYNAHKPVYGMDDAGNFMSAATENYPSAMNKLIAEALIESCGPENLQAQDPLERWCGYFDVANNDGASITWPVQRDVADAPTPTRLLESAAPLLTAAGVFSNELYQTGIDGQYFVAPRETVSDNPSYRQARASEQWPSWEKACEAEIDNLRRNGTIDENQAIPENTLPSWDPAKKRATQVVNILWVLRVKYIDGAFDKFKARAVFDGRDQKAKNPLLETFSPACRSTTHKLLTAEACRLGLRLLTWDVEAAYLKGVFTDGSDPLYGRPPPGYRSYVNGIAMIWMLNTPLYGEADAGRIWYKTLVKFLLEERGFTQSKYDPCLFWKTFVDKSRIYYVIYVDDGFSADNGSKEADAELEAINARFKIEIKPASFFLGNNVTCHSRTCVTLSSRAYIERIALRYLPDPIESYPTFKVPSDRELVVSYELALEARRNNSPVDVQLRETYASKVGALIYVVPVCRVDCALTIGILARCLTFSTEAMDRAADGCLVFLAQHPDTGITYNGNAERPELHAYSDSNWTIGHSTSGWGILYCGAVIGYGSKRQQSIALSSTEAEIMAASMAATEILYFRGLLFELGHELDPTVLYVDNQGAVELSRDMKSCQRSRHIERRYLRIRELVATGDIVVKFIATFSNSSDILTKPLEFADFTRHSHALMGDPPNSI